ncbi:hypothetical protein ACIBQ0_12680 [Nocardia nova]
MVPMVVYALLGGSRTTRVSTGARPTYVPSGVCGPVAA